MARTDQAVLVAHLDGIFGSQSQALGVCGVQGSVRAKRHVGHLRREAEHIAAVVKRWAVDQPQAAVDRRQVRLLGRW